ncbi:hypothetical protein ABPG72_016539 [Tetrahymena utriculariae]
MHIIGTSHLITQNQEITIIISKQITLSPQEAGDYIAKNYKKSNKGITVILNKPKAPVDLKKIVRGNATDKKKQAHEISKFLEKLKSLKQKERQQEKKIEIESIQEEQNENQSREEKINPSQIKPDLKSASPNKQLLQQQQLINQNKNKHQPEIQLYNFNQIRNIEQVQGSSLIRQQLTNYMNMNYLKQILCILFQSMTVWIRMQMIIASGLCSERKGETIYITKKIFDIEFFSSKLINQNQINKNIQLMSTSDFVKGLIISYMDQGLSSRQTSERISGLINKYNPQNRMVDENFEQQFQISYKTCAKIFNRFKNELSYQDLRENNGKEPIYNQEEQENIVQRVEENIGLNLKDIAQNEDINSREASMSTMRRILINNEIKCYKQPKKIILSQQNKDDRFSFAKQTSSWSKNWQRVLFTDECQLCMNPENKFFYTSQQENIPPSLFKEQKQYPIKAHVWGCISYKGPLKLVLIEGNLNSEKNSYNSMKKRIEQVYIQEGDNI